MKYNLLGAVSTIALGAAFGFGTPGAANAALTCQTVAGPGVTGSNAAGNTVGAHSCSILTTAPLALTPRQVTFTLDKWLSNASAGFVENLTGVKWTVSELLSGSGVIGNTDTVAITASFSSKTALLASSSTPSNFINPIFSKTANINGPVVSLAPTTQPGSTTLYTYTANLSGSRTVSGSLAGFIGPGTFSALVSAIMGLGGINTDPAGNSSGNVTTSAAPTIQLTYTFTTAQPPPPPSPTPEPASLALLGAGLAGLGAVRRRKKA